MRSPEVLVALLRQWTEEIDLSILTEGELVQVHELVCELTDQLLEEAFRRET